MGALLAFFGKIIAAVAGMYGGIPGWVISLVMLVWAITDIVSFFVSFA